MLMLVGVCFATTAQNVAQKGKTDRRELTQELKPMAAASTPTLESCRTSVNLIGRGAILTCAGLRAAKWSAEPAQNGWAREPCWQFGGGMARLHEEREHAVGGTVSGVLRRIGGQEKKTGSGGRWKVWFGKRPACCQRWAGEGDGNQKTQNGQPGGPKRGENR